MSRPAMPAAPTAAIPSRPPPRPRASATPRSAAASRTPITSAARVTNSGSSTPPTAAGTYTVVAAFTSTDPELRQHVERTADVHDQPGHANRRGQRCRWHRTAAIPSRPRPRLPASATPWSAAALHTPITSAAASAIPDQRHRRPPPARTPSSQRFTSTDPDYSNASSAPLTFTISARQRRPWWPAMPAAPTAAIPSRPRATATGIGNATVSGSFAYTYYVGSSGQQLRISDTADRRRHLHRRRGFHKHRSRTTATHRAHR